MEVSKLEMLCLRNVAMNVVRHSVNYKTRHFGKTPPMEYVFFQRLYSEQLITVVSSLVKSQSQPSNDEEREFYEYLMNGKMCSFPIEECMNFIFNSHLKFFEALYFDEAVVANAILPTVAMNCQNLTAMNLSRRRLPFDLLLSTLRHIPNVISLNFSYTNINSYLLLEICDLCPKIEYLNVKFTEIDDSCLYKLCGKQPVKKNECPKYRLNRNIQWLCLAETRTTFSGLECALETLPALRVLHGDKMYKWHHNDVVTAMTQLLKRQGNCSPQKTFNITELYFNDWAHSLEDMKLCLDACPKLKCVMLKLFHEKSKQFFKLSEFSCLKKLVLHSYKPVIRSREFMDFLRIKGNQLDSLSVHLGWQVIESSTIRKILELCPKSTGIAFAFAREQRRALDERAEEDSKQ